MKEVTIKDENYIQISGWMLNELNLKGNELIIYALIHGFSQDGKSDYHGGLTYISLWTNSTKQGVIKALKSLLEKGLIVKEVYEENGVQYARYWTVKSRESQTTKHKTSGKQSLPDTTQSTEFTTTQSESGKQSLMGVNKVYHTQSTEFNGGSQLSLPYKNSEILGENSTASANEKKSEKAAEDFIKIKLQELFEGHFVFDNKFIPEIKVLSNVFKLSEEQIIQYLDFVYSRVKDKRPKSFTNMFYKMAISPNIMQDFLFEHDTFNLSVEQTKSKCPVCGTTVSSGICPRCEFDMNDQFDSQLIMLKKQIYNLPEDKRAVFNAEYYAELERQSSYGINALISNPDLKKEFNERINEIYLKFGITA